MSNSDFRPPTSEFRPAAAGLRNRLRLLLIGFAILACTVYGRLIALEVRDGPEYRTMAAKPTTRQHTIAGRRGRILAADGTVLAYDQPLVCLAVQYRWLEQPADPIWLQKMARSRLSRAQRRDPHRMAAAQQEVLKDRQALWHRLATLCGLSDEEWQARAQRIQQHVEAIAASINARGVSRQEIQRRELDEELLDESDPTDWPTMIGHSIVDALFSLDDHSPPRITVTEELSAHVIFEGLSLEAVTEIESRAGQFPGVKLTQTYQRVYPQKELAAHWVGYLSHPTAKEVDANDYVTDDWLGRAGLERQYESLLRGRRGVIIDQFDAYGKVIASATQRQPTVGRDLIVSLDPALERSAQTLLDQALARRLPSGNERLDAASGGALVVMDINDGAVLAAASGPRFDPNDFVHQDRSRVEQWLNDPARPLLNRTVQMALPPGSVFKIISAAAALDAGVDPQAPVDCRGYLHQPDALRCAIFRRTGVGHGQVTLADALARSCNVYFFHHAEQFGLAPLLDWARRFELGRPTGVDLPGEINGTLPEARIVDKKSGPITLTSSAALAGAPDPRLLAIGQGPLTVTPLQMVRVIAAIANGGKLVTPHLAIHLAPTAGRNATTICDGASRVGHSIDDLIQIQPPRQIAGLKADMIESIRKGLRRAVTDPEGTAHATVESSEVAIAGKTGTAETGANQPEDAWFAGYAPADHPRVAFVVVLEHAGNADTAAGPVVRNLVERMNDLGYFNSENLPTKVSGVRPIKVQ